MDYGGGREVDRIPCIHYRIIERSIKVELNSDEIIEFFLYFSQQKNKQKFI